MKKKMLIRSITKRGTLRYGIPKAVFMHYAKKASPSPKQKITPKRGQ